ncbi:hypothetical protein Sjap_020553 [Stephania japonica]|uniref:Uncharacterized protein n=1 Tax=Stephania japonica TaxID=461633 RepID=A0AAP0F9U8_9MAGN
MDDNLEHNSNISSLVSIISLYVAGATLVCLLFITLDVHAGFRNRKRRLPCCLSSLNSATLAVLAVATKLPVDLTSSMPSALDQLSKLTGTTFICIYMGFLVPSPRVTTVSEWLSNMISLSIFVITILLWFNADDIDFQKNSPAYHIKSYITGSQGSLLQRLENIYFTRSNPSIFRRDEELRRDFRLWMVNVDYCCKPSHLCPCWLFWHNHQISLNGYTS